MELLAEGTKVSLDFTRASVPQDAHDIVCENPFWYTRSALSIKEVYGLRSTLHTKRVSDDVLRTITRLNDEEDRSVPRLGLVDWAVINYMKEIPCMCIVDGTIVNVHQSDLEVCSMLHRPLFDPFRRGAPIYFEVDGQSDYTSVGQLNFVLWALNANVLAFVQDNADDIRAHRARVHGTKEYKPCKRRHTLVKTTRAPIILERGDAEIVFDTAAELQAMKDAQRALHKRAMDTDAFLNDTQ